ncbi:hypothetical protein [Streptomyces sp. NPDC059894]|uniref:hypothetical protein n=1 Tax=unclassified Streptomyces TaxID=2593676 RepID=UPI0036674E0F
MSLYHATKWGNEGFRESSAAELAPFGFCVTIVEPGMSRTTFGAGNSVLGAPPDERPRTMSPTPFSPARTRHPPPPVPAGGSVRP